MVRGIMLATKAVSYFSHCIEVEHLGVGGVHYMEWRALVQLSCTNVGKKHTCPCERWMNVE